MNIFNIKNLYIYVSIITTKEHIKN